MRLALRATLVACSIVGCGDSSGQPDAAGPWTVTVDHSHVVGMVTSDPSGILCGSCAITQGCGSAPATGSDCSAAFPVGTSITLHVTEQQVYGTTYCTFDGGSAGRACTFVPEHPTTVVVWGSTAVR